MEQIVKKPEFKSQYDNYINGQFVAPINGKYFDNISPIDGKVFTKVAHSSKEDLELAVNAAAEAFKTWSKTSATERSIILHKIAQRMEDNLEYLATVETIDNGKAIRETLNADLPLSVDHFRYFSGVIRAEEGSHTELDEHCLLYTSPSPRDLRYHLVFRLMLEKRGG
ncbi:aldehyde dehydrogenase family protein, partial [Pedobacter sp. ASV28]|uniref:aldehyde dehydrogenase family protein n=1 Tax=Pedobacter sp. ASV28 TaxID=2795123 RepID=UPI0018EB74CE